MEEKNENVSQPEENENTVNKPEDAENTSQAAKEPEEINELEETKKKLAELNDRLLRTMAEYDNFRKRTQKEKENIYPDAISVAVLSILPVIDNFELALNSECSDGNFKKGMEMIFSQMADSLKSLNVVEINPAGQPFDPAEHNAVMHITDENVGENTVVEVLRKGYKLGDKIIRFAMVKVAN